MRYRTGAFARAAGVTVRTVRYYDQIGLLRPAEVDPASGYRAYTPAQLHDLRRILDLKALDFTLEEIGAVLAGALTPHDMRGLLEAKRDEARRPAREAAERLERLDRWLAGLGEGGATAGSDAARPG